MGGYATKIENLIETFEFNQLLEMREIYANYLSEVPELTFYKNIERLKKKGILVNIGRGIYYKPKETKYGIVPITEKDITEKYTKGNSGLVIGYQLCNQKGITTQVVKRIEVLSNSINAEVKNINNVKINRTKLLLDEKTIPIIETLEILKCFEKAEDTNDGALIEYMTQFAKNYDDKIADYILENKKYKKSTIAFLAEILNNLNIENKLNKHLSNLSSYKIPKLEVRYEFA